MVPTLDGLSTPAFSNLASTMTQALKPVVDSTFLTEISNIAKERTSLLQDIAKPFNDMWADQFSELTKNIGKLVEGSYPPNWKADKPLLLPSNLETLLLDEGLPLAWTPPYHVLEKVFLAKTYGERRKVLFNNRQGILNSCLMELRPIEKEEIRLYRDFAIEAVESINAGHWKAGQALCTNIIDSVTRKLFDNNSRLELTSHRNGRRIDWKSYPVRRALVFGGIWGSYIEYWPDNNRDNIPRQYTRHATTHAVSAKQYTKINSLIAIMHVTAFLKLLDEDFSND